MRSLPASDAAIAALFFALLVAAWWFVSGVIGQHRKEHGHCTAKPALNVESAKRDGNQTDGGFTGHDGSIPAYLPKKNVRGGCP